MPSTLTGMHPHAIEAWRERGAAVACACMQCTWEAARTCMAVAPDTSQPLMSSLKVQQAVLQSLLSPQLSLCEQKSSEKSSTLETSHVPMGP